jgi:hypothetical protein
MLARVAALEGRVVPALRVPVLTPRLSSYWLKLVSGADYHVARELVLGLSSDLLPKDERWWELTNHGPRRGFDAAARRALAVERAPHGAARLEEAIVGHIGRRLRSRHAGGRAGP